MHTWTSFLPDILTSLNSKEYYVPSGIILGTDAFMVPSPDMQDLQFSFPLRIRTGLSEEYSLPLSSSSGAIHAIIEHCKKTAKKKAESGILYGSHTGNQTRYSANIEPCTVAYSKTSIATNLWRPDEHNFMDRGEIQLVIRGAFPFTPPNNDNYNKVRSNLQGYTESIVESALNTPRNLIKKSWETVYDQQDIRAGLADKSLVSVIVDGTRPARTYTRYRCWFRVAGPKDGVHIPFYCPEDLDPVEIPLKGSNRTVSGLGIKKGEIFTITGSNSEGKSTLLQGIIAGEDDHAPGDGRELLVSIPGGTEIDATNIELRGADLRPFFREIPPGVSGTPDSVFGYGSGSASMAHKFNEAIRKKATYIIIDEDRSAINLLIPCYMSNTTIHSLAALIQNNRNWLCETSLIIAGSGMELLISQSDRIIRLSNHRTEKISPSDYREGLKKHYKYLIDMTSNNDSLNPG